MKWLLTVHEKIEKGGGKKGYKSRSFVTVWTKRKLLTQRARGEGKKGEKGRQRPIKRRRGGEEVCGFKYKKKANKGRTGKNKKKKKKKRKGGGGGELSLLQLPHFPISLLFLRPGGKKKSSAILPLYFRNFILFYEGEKEERM